jgi:hypothetical protein
MRKENDPVTVFETVYPWKQNTEHGTGETKK